MKLCSAIFAVALMAILLGCGADGETATSAITTDRGSGDRTATEITAAQQGPDYPVPTVPAKRPPLEKLVVRELKIGKGPLARRGDHVAVRYVGAFWKTGKIFSQHWNSRLDFTLDGEMYGPGWQKGIEGMRVGGRRELVIPGRLLFSGGTDAVYILTLDKVKPGASG